MKEISYDKYYNPYGNGIVFNIVGTKREHLELLEKGIFTYKNYECYASDIKDVNLERLDDIENFKIIVIKENKE